MKKTLRFVFLIFALFICTISVGAKKITCLYEGQRTYIAVDGSVYKVKHEITFNNDKISEITYIYDDSFESSSNYVHFEKHHCPTTIYEGRDIEISSQERLFDYPPEYTVDQYTLIDKYSSHVYCGSDKQGRITGIPKKIPELTSLAITIIQIAIPIILVLMGSIDLFKGVTAGKEDEMKKGQQLFIKRLIVGAMIFFVVVIVKFFISIVADTNQTNIVDCIDCFISNDCEGDFDL